MTKPGYLVEGYLEKKFIQRICPNSVVRLLRCNGENVSLQAIAKRVITQCRLLNGKCYPVIVVVDRENRKQSADQMATELLSLVRDEDVDDELIVAVADRNIENWIIADTQTINDIYPKLKPSWGKQHNGFNGKAKLKKAIGTYHETTTGVDLLLKCRPSAMRSSPSFDRFFQQVASLNCWWLSK